jgi:hypothetical protein
MRISVKQYPADPGKDAFARKLREFYSEYMRPPYRTLVNISAELKQLYPDLRSKPPQLTLAAISEILNGKRVDPPDPEWLVSFVLSCQRWAWQIGAIPLDPGTSSLQEWHAALRTARETPAPAPVGERAGGGAPADAPMYICPPSTVRLTPAQLEHLGSYGRYGHELIGQVQAGLPAAVYRAALLLGADPVHADAAQALLLQAAAAYHPAALELLDANGWYPGPLETARHACKVADAAQAGASHEEALVYYECAARAGSTIARLRFAIARLGEHDEHQVAGWLAAIIDQLESDDD